MVLRERSRSFQTGSASYDYAIPPATGRTSGTVSYSMSELMFDSTHDLSLLGIRDCGGAMYHEFEGYRSVTPGRAYIPGWDGYADVRPPATIVGAAAITTPSDLGEDALWSQGAKAIAATDPSNPAFSLSTAFGELREGVPKLIGSHLLRDRAHLARGAGKEYLNVEFGWKPLIRDLKDLGHLVLNSDKIRAQYIRDSGRAVHRRWTPPGGDVITGATKFGYATAFWGTGYSVTCEGTQSNSYRETTQFSGAFRYFIPEPRDAGSKWKRWNMLGRQLAGLSVDSLPETVWNLAPWSWLVDWHGDVGSLITNITSLGSDSRQLTYGYLTRRAVTRRAISVNTASYSSKLYLRKLQLASVWESGVVRRVKASPFGFGLEPVDYSPRQLAILAALGLSRS